jgi:ABC-type cobalamin/Fe3+-siderophores transport system ATPase subunit
MEELLRFHNVHFAYGEEEPQIFAGLDLSLPPGTTALLGPNGSGKTTFLLLAGGRLLPQQGSVRLIDRDTTRLQDDTLRNRYASFVYQNMEFESEAPVGELLEAVLQNGFYERKDPGLIPQLTRVLELEGLTGRRTQELSKGELQRVIIAFAVLYGPKTLMMDEPIFALEQQQKERAMEFLTGFVAEQGISLLYSVHELEISRRYADRILLFHSGGVELGPVEELTGREKLEQAYQVPYHTLHRRERLFREGLLRISEEERKEGDER